METNQVFEAIGRSLPPTEAVQVLSALRQDALVWASLEEEGFLQAVLKTAPQGSAWRPGQLALLSITNQSPPDLRAEPLAALPQALHEKALRAYQTAQRTAAAPSTLREAGLLALALRERRRLTGSWNGLLQDLLPKSAPAETWFRAWRTALVCLYDLIPDTAELLRALLPQRSQLSQRMCRAAYEWIAHTQLSQPRAQAQHVQSFTTVLQGKSVSSQLAVLRAISMRGQEVLAGAVADRLLVGHPAFNEIRNPSQQPSVDIDSLSLRALLLQQMGSFYKLAGDQKQAMALYNAAESTLNQWLAGLCLQRANLQEGAAAGSFDSAKIAQMAAAAPWIKEELGVVLLDARYDAGILEHIPTEIESAFVYLKRAAGMTEREPAVARDLARQGCQGLLETLAQHSAPFGGEYVYSWDPAEVVRILLDLDLPQDAQSLAEAILNNRPADVTVLHSAATIQERLGNRPGAVTFLQRAMYLQPHEPRWVRELGRLNSLLGQWEQAFAYYRSVLAMSEPALVSDRLACAQAALRAGSTQAAVEISEAVVQEDANSGMALNILGQALVQRGEMQQAQTYLVRATLLQPEVVDAWLALAKAQIALEQPQRAIETLRSAVAVAPESPEANLALGTACVQLGCYAEALPYLKKAFLLAPDEEECVPLYAHTLRLLGHTAESRSILERARSQWARHPELAFEYAQALVDSGEAEAALPVLENALRSGLPIVDAHLLYARILLDACATDGVREAVDETTARRLQEAGAALQNILELDPNNIEARFLVAELHLEKGELQTALEQFQALAKVPSAAASELRWRVQWGQARTALRLNQIDMALAAFQEACQSRPDYLPLKRGLAEATLRAGLADEALSAAQDALQLNPDAVDNLVWFAEFVARMDGYPLAVETLERAAQIDPQRLDVLLLLAEHQLSAGEQDAARESLRKVSAAPRVAAADLRWAGRVYLRLKDRNEALECYAQAVDVLEADGAAPAPEFLLEIADLSERLGLTESALALVQQASDGAPGDLNILLLQVDFLGRLRRPQAALAVLEHALHVAEQNAAGANVLSAIHQRFTQHWLAEEALSHALEHAEQALLFNKDSAALVYQATNMALALLQNERAVGTLASILPDGQSAGQFLQANGPIGLDLLCLKMELCLEQGANEEADRLAVEGLGYDAGAPRVLAARSRLYARAGDGSSAGRWYRAALDACQNSGMELPGAVVNVAPPVWLADAALEAGCWQETIALLDGCTRSHPADARVWLRLARALTLAAETQVLCALLDSHHNAPGAMALDEQHQHKFMNAIQSAGRIASVPVVNNWLVRGQAVFTPTSQSTRALAAVATATTATAGDTAALIAALRQLNNRAAAAQVARRFPKDPAVLLQLALCGIDDDPNEGAVIAARAVAACAGHMPVGLFLPLVQAGFALLARRNGQFSDALAAYRAALAQWFQEACWHDYAGDLCLQLGQLDGCVQHRRSALELEPGNAVFARKLGQLYTAQNDIPAAINILEQAAALDPKCASTWLALASVYQMAGQLPEALEAAKQASEIETKNAEALLIAGEIACQMHMPEQALAFAKAAVQIEPENAAALLFYSSVLVQLDRKPEALLVLEEASTSVKASYPLAAERVRLLFELNGAQAALKLLNTLVNDHPEEADLLAMMAQVQAECGDIRLAERFAAKALKLDPNQPDLTLMLGRMQHNDGQLDQAVHLFAEVIRMAPDTLEAYLELGTVYQERREYTQALQVYRQAMRIASNDYRAYYQSGLLLRDSKDYHGAEELLRRAAELAPENLAIRRQLVGVIALNLVHAHSEVPA